MRRRPPDRLSGPPMASTTRLDRVLSGVVVLLSIAALGWTATRAKPAPDGVAVALASYAEAAGALPGSGPVGFIAATPDPGSADTERDLAQHALAPRVLVPDLARVSFAVSSRGATSSLDRDPRLSSFTFVV